MINVKRLIVFHQEWRSCMISQGRIFFTMITALFIASCTGQGTAAHDMKVNTIDLSPFSAEAPKKPVHLLFIHHSTGGQLLADIGSESGKDCIYASHPNGGGLRGLLSANNYVVHEASYGSIIGDKTDICHWNAKFRDDMEKILTCSRQDTFFTDGTRNRIVVFKSCFPNNMLVSDGTAPGDPDDCAKTLANAQAAYRAILPSLKRNPATLFVAFTAPPLVRPIQYKKDKIIEALKVFTGRPDTLDKIGRRARFFNNWLKDAEHGWLHGYARKNVVVFDYYDILTDYGKSDWTAYPSRAGQDSHPNSEGNTRAARAFVPFLNQALHRFIHG